MMHKKENKVDIELEAPIDDKDDVEEEEEWGSRWSFILAAIGSAVGLGNFWRFPYLVFRWKAGVFFIPYIIALVFVGIPLLQLEMALGQVFRRACTQSFGTLHPRFRGIGLGAAFIAFGIVTYYCAILAWGNVFLVKCFWKELPWSVRGLNGTDVLTVPEDHFYNEILQLSPEPMQSSIISSVAFAGAVFMWFCVFLILFKGHAFISKIVWATVLIPVGMLIILVVVGATLPGAGIGINRYIGRWDFSLLSDLDMWVDAVGQIFFSLSLSTGVMSAFASRNHRHQNIVQDAVIVAVSNSLFSFLSGFAVFAIAGYLSEASGLGDGLFDDEVLSGYLSGPKLAFVTYPSGLSLISGGWANVLCFLFFVTFFFLGVDSAFSLVESVMDNFLETHMFAKLSRKQMAILCCGIGSIWTVLYCADIGYYLFDLVDDYVSGFGLLIIGFLESFVAGWVYNKSEAMHQVGVIPVLLFDISFLGGLFLFFLLALSLSNDPDLSVSARAAIPAALGFGMLVIGSSFAITLASPKAKSVKDAVYFLCLDGPESLRLKLNRAITNDGEVKNWVFPRMWSVLIKFLITPILMFLILSKTESRIIQPYGGYPWIYQAFGLALLLIILSLVGVGFFFPNLYEDPKRRNNLF